MKPWSHPKTKWKQEMGYPKVCVKCWWFGAWILFSISYMRCHPSHWLSYFSEGLKPPTSNVGYSSQKLRHQSRSTEKPHSHGSNQRRNTCWESCLGCGSWPFIPFTLLLAKAENEPGRHTATAFCTDKTTKGRVLPRPSSGCNLSNPLCHKPTITGDGLYNLFRGDSKWWWLGDGLCHWVSNMI